MKLVVSLLLLATLSCSAGDFGALLGCDSTLLNKLVAYWQFNEQAGTRYDCAGDNHGLPASVGGLPSTVAGKVGSAIHFTKANQDFLLITNKAAIRLENNSPVTIALWVNRDTSVDGHVLSKCSSVQATNIEYKLWISANQAYFGIGNGISFAIAGPTATISATEWHLLIGYYDPVAQTVSVKLDTNAVSSVAWTGGTLTNSANLNIARFNGNNTDYLNGSVDELGIWKRVLTTNEHALLYQGISHKGFYPQSSRSITSPAAYQVFQRTGTNGNILVSGAVEPGMTRTVEARFNGGAWQTIQANATTAYSGYITNQPQGQGAVEVRYADLTDNIFPIYPVGIGDVFGIAGQSNASGHGQNLQYASNTTAFVSMLSNKYLWERLGDPVDSSVLQVDYVSSDLTAPGNTWGSIWPLLSTQIADNQNVPVAFVPCPLGGTDAGQWQPGAVHTNRLTLYGSAVWRAKYAAGGVKALLWWQGENEMNFGTNQATYYNALTNLAYNWFTDSGAKLMPCKLQHIVGLAQANQDAINNAIAQAWTNNTNWVLTGPDLSPINTDNGSHITTDASLLSAALRWWTNIQTAFY